MAEGKTTRSAGETDAPEPLLDPAFLALLCCPVCAERPPLRLAEDNTRLLCDRCGTAYPIVAEYGFPDLRPPAADLSSPAGGEATPA